MGEEKGIGEMKQIKESAELPTDESIDFLIFEPTQEELDFIEFLRRGEKDFERAKQNMVIPTNKLRFYKSYSEKVASENEL